MNFELDIISRDADNNGEVFQSYDINGERTIGVSKKEPFAIRFKNNTWNRVQVRLSVDGTDILTGKKASTEPKGKMWVVEANDTLEIEAWPEDNKGGARFVFGEAGKGVAVNTHGDTRGVGLIAAAVFTERYDGGMVFLSGGCYDSWNSDRVTCNAYNFGGNAAINTYATKCAVEPQRPRSTVDDRRYGRSKAIGAAKAALRDRDKQLDGLCCFQGEPEPAVGAGEHVDQTIVKTAGLCNPGLQETIEIKYEWWNTLRRKIGRYVGKSESTAFPGNREERNINLRGVPKQRSTGRCPVYKYL